MEITMMKYRKKPDLLSSSQLSKIICWVFYSIIIPSALSAISADGFKKCETKAAFNLPAVTPLWEEEISAVGCFSNNISSRGQEIHVLHIKSVDDLQEPHVTTVHIRSEDEKQLDYERPLVFLLHADFKTSWKIVGNQINSSLHRIIVTHGSQVVENHDLQVTIQRRPSGEIKHLLSWLNRKYRTLTSYTRLEGANNIYFTLGNKNIEIPAKCDISSRKIVPNVKAFVKDVIPIGQRQGCVAKGHVGTANRMVHIVKIHEVDGGLVSDFADQLPKVAVHVTSQSKHYSTKDLALILQSAQPVEWVLINEGTKGRLDVVTEGKVVAPQQVLSLPQVSVRSEPLPNNTKQLMSYTMDWFGPSFTFTEVWRANNIKVYIDLDDEEGPPPAPKLFGTGHRPRAVNTEDMIKAHRRNEHKRRLGSETHSLIKSKRPLKPNDLFRVPSVMLLDVMVVECLPQYMRASFPKMSMEQLGLQPQHVTLIDSHCSVNVNDTHFVLSSPFHDCGTVREVEDDKVVYKNAVHFHFEVQKLGSLYGSLMQSDSSTSPESENIGKGSSSLPEGDSPEAKTLEFQCEYFRPDMPSHDSDSSPTTRDTTTLTAARELFSLELSRDPSFIRPVAQSEYPFTVHDHDIVYVETRLDAGNELHVVTEDCWLSENDDPKSTPVAKLIANGCPTGPNVRFDSSGDLASNRFSFQLDGEYTKYSSLHLQCKLGVCTSDNSHSNKWGLKICIDPKDFCMIDSLRSTYLELTRGTHHNIFTRGPFHVKKRPENTRNPLSSIPLRQGKIDLEVKGSETFDVRCTIPEPQNVVVMGLSFESVIGIAFASFIIGVGLSAVLWCIYLRTDPLRALHKHHHHSGFDLSGHSGSSTPSSRSPIAP
ncbi:Transforming growth factor, beta receptor III [Chamberlinius hualienensis]